MGYITNDNNEKDSTVLEEIKLFNTIFKMCSSHIYESVYTKGPTKLIDTIELFVSGNKHNVADLQKEIIYISWHAKDQKNAILEQMKNQNSNAMFNEYEKTGMKEREDQLWIHPIRSNQYRINEVSPFPYVHYPLKIGSYWSFSIKTNDAWGEWSNMDVASEYSITDTINLINFKNEPSKCWVIDAYSEYKTSQSKATFYFNEKLGFVKTVQKFENGISIETRLIDIN